MFISSHLHKFNYMYHCSCEVCQGDSNSPLAVVLSQHPSTGRGTVTARLQLCCHNTAAQGEEQLLPACSCAVTTPQHRVRNSYCSPAVVLSQTGAQTDVKGNLQHRPTYREILHRRGLTQADVHTTQTRLGTGRRSFSTYEAWHRPTFIQHRRGLTQADVDATETRLDTGRRSYSTDEAWHRPTFIQHRRGLAQSDSAYNTDKVWHRPTITAQTRLDTGRRSYNTDKAWHRPTFIQHRRGLAHADVHTPHTRLGTGRQHCYHGCKSRDTWPAVHHMEIFVIQLVWSEAYLVGDAWECLRSVMCLFTADVCTTLYTLSTLRPWSIWLMSNVHHNWELCDNNANGNLSRNKYKYPWWFLFF